jgi:hypothetical protein
MNYFYSQSMLMRGARIRKPRDEASHWRLIYHYRRFLQLMEGILSEGGQRSVWDLETID